MDSNAPPLSHHEGNKEMPEAPRLLFRMLSDHRRELTFWTLNATYWLIFGAIGLLITRAFRSGMPDVHLAVLIRVTSGFVLTSALRLIYGHPRFRQRRARVKWIWVLASFVMLGLLEMAFFQGLVGAGVHLPGGLETGGVKLWLVRMFNLGLWSALYFAFHLFETQHALEMRTIKAELAAREHELRRLQAQMNPYFIFSALNGTLACKTDPEAVEELTQSLIDHLRFLLRDTLEMEPLACELEALEKFLSIQASRLQNSLICRIYMDSRAAKVNLPPMTIQPLLEDAFHHRPQSTETPLHIWLTARVEEGVLNATLSYSGDGPPLDAGDTASGDILALSKRLNLLLGSRAHVERHHDGGWTRTSVIVRLDAPA